MEDCKIEESSFKGYDNHTLREISLYRPLEPLLTRKSKPAKGDSGVIEVALTEIDEYFDDGFVIGYNNYCSHRTATERPLNSREHWEEVEEKLYALAIKVETSYSRYYGTKMIFHVPVTGTWLIPNDRTRKVEDDWLFWKGKYYDPSFVYTLHYGGGNATATDLLPLCPLRMGRWNSALNPSSVKPSADSEDGSILLSCGYYDNMCGEREYLDIDLGSICHVTKLVSTGCYPSNLKSFPKFQSPRGLRGHDMHRMHEKRKGLRRKQVWVIEDTSTLSWVTRYEVMYRNQKGKWLKYSSIFEGNVDVATERAHAVDFIARYVRIIPLDCHVRKAMTMNVFGIAGVNAKKYREAPVGTEESNEVIIYELEAPQASKYRPIGSHKSLFERHEKARNNARRQTSLRRDLCYTMKHEL